MELGTEYRKKEKEIKEKSEESKKREKADKGKKVREKRKLFERIAEKKKKETDQDNTKLIKRKENNDSERMIENDSLESVKIKPAAASGIRGGKVDLKLKTRVDIPSTEGKNKIKSKINNCVAAKITSFAGFTVGKSLKHWDRRHLPLELDTMENMGVEGKVEVGREEPSQSRVGANQLTCLQSDFVTGLTRSVSKNTDEINT